MGCPSMGRSGFGRGRSSRSSRVLKWPGPSRGASAGSVARLAGSYVGATASMLRA